MKKLLTLSFAVLLFAAIGCQEGNSIVNPNSDITQDRLAKVGDLPLTSETSDITLLKYSKVLTMDGSKQGKVKFSYRFIDGSTVDAELTLDKGAFEGEKTFTITFDASDKSVNLTPHGSVFAIPAHLTLKYKGLDFSKDPVVAGVDWTDAKFVYFPDDEESYEVMDYHSISVNPINGQLFVVNARLPHFSRFGFCR